MKISKLKKFKVNLKTNTFKAQNGNISLFSVFLVFFIVIVFLILIDISRIFTARIIVKSAADAASLAAVQKMLYFELDSEEIKNTAKLIVDSNNCNLEYINIGYDEVNVEVSKNINFVLLSIIKENTIGFNVSRSAQIFAVSKAKVIYPWDEKFNSCKRVKFDF